MPFVIFKLLRCSQHVSAASYQANTCIVPNCTVKQLQDQIGLRVHFFRRGVMLVLVVTSSKSSRGWWRNVLISQSKPLLCSQVWLHRWASAITSPGWFRGRGILPTDNAGPGRRHCHPPKKVGSQQWCVSPKKSGKTRGAIWSTRRFPHSTWSPPWTWWEW